MTRDTRRVLIGFAVLVVAGLMLGVLAAGGGNTPTSAPQENNQPHNGRAASQGSPQIPGLQRVDVTMSLERLVFKCEGPRYERGRQWWTCSKTDPRADYRVEVWGRSSTDITLVEATLISYDPANTDRAARAFLGYVATVPYDGATPKAARAWVAQHVGSRATTEFGGVRYALQTSGETRILEIGNVA